MFQALLTIPGIFDPPPSPGASVTGGVSITGTPALGQMLTASNTLAAPAGMATISYQWAAGGTIISGATTSTFVVTAAQLATPIAVVASYVDGLGNAGSATSGTVIPGGPGNNIFSGGTGNDTIGGGPALDTVVFTGPASQYQVSQSGGNILVTGANGTDTLLNVERLHFADKSIAFDVNGDAGEAYRLYQAAFNRAPDIGGLGYQMKALDDGLPLATVAQNFINSPEFSATYGSLNTTDFINQMYANVLHRAPDPGGLQFYTDNITSGAMTRAAVLVGFSESPENQAALIGVIQHGMTYTV